MYDTRNSYLQQRLFFGGITKGVLRPAITPSCKLIHVALQVFWGHPVIRSIESTFHYSPEALHAVRVNLIVHVLTEQSV